MTIRSLSLAALMFSIDAAQAHHSFAMFDTTKKESVQGTVLKYEWTNPHAWIWVNSNVNGKETPYAFELASLAMLRRQGWTRDDLHQGDKVEVTYRPFKDGQNGGQTLTVKLASGKVLGDRGANGPPGSGGPPGGAPPAGA
jgi:hypothetical protein